MQQSPIARLHRPEHAGAPFDSIIFFQLSPALTGGAFPEAGRRQARLGSVDFREFVSKQGFHLRLRTETENPGVLCVASGANQ